MKVLIGKSIIFFSKPEVRIKSAPDGSINSAGRVILFLISIFEISVPINIKLLLLSNLYKVYGLAEKRPTRLSGFFKCKNRPISAVCTGKVCPYHIHPCSYYDQISWCIIDVQHLVINDQLAILNFGINAEVMIF